MHYTCRIRKSGNLKKGIILTNTMDYKTLVSTRIRELVPSLQKLEWGCEVMYGDDLQEPRKVTLGNPYSHENGKVYNPWNRDDTSALFEIIGKPIQLADVLLAINKVWTGEKYVFSSTGKLGHIDDVDHGEPIDYNLSLDHDNQSPKYYQFMWELLN